MAGKIQLCALILLAFMLSFKVFAHPIDDIILANPQFSKSIVAISVKDENSQAILYQRDADILVHPASTLKVVTSGGVIDYLGKDYQFKTELYKKNEKTYLKLGADPLFGYQDMADLVNQYKSRNEPVVKTLIIDDTIIDKVPFGIGWQWDDNADVHFSQVSPYILNRNLFSVNAKLSLKNNVVIEQPKIYKEPLVNKLTFGTESDVISSRNLFDDNSSVILQGTINSDTSIHIPAKNPKQMYNDFLIYYFLSNGVAINTHFKYAKLPRFAAQQAVISHSIDDVIKHINSNSDNLAAEILLKHAGAAKSEKAGTTADGLDIVRNFYKLKGLNVDDMQFVDASGISMNDYVTADFMTEALIVLASSRHSGMIKNSLSDGTNGTFKGRLTELNGKLKVKTGTLANTSAVVGFIRAHNGRNLVFAIMLDNLPRNVRPKEFENEIIKAIYNL